MSVDHSRIGVVFRSQRARKQRQLEAIKADGAQWIVLVPEEVKSWREITRQLQDGDEVRIFALCLVPTKRGGDKLSPTAQVAAFMVECVERGAIVIEVYTGRVSTKKRQRDEMIADAVEALQRGPRELPDIGREPGRPRKEWPPGTEEKAREMWKSKDFATREAAQRHILKLHKDVTLALVRRLGRWPGVKRNR